MSSTPHHDTLTLVLLVDLRSGTLLSSYRHQPSSSSPPPSLCETANLASLLFALQRNAKAALPSHPDPVLKSYILPNNQICGFACANHVLVAVQKNEFELGSDLTSVALIKQHCVSLAQIIADMPNLTKVSRTMFVQASKALADHIIAASPCAELLKEMAGATVFSGRCLLSLLNLTKRGGYDMETDKFVDDFGDEDDEEEERLPSMTTGGGEVSAASAERTLRRAIG